MIADQVTDPIAEIQGRLAAYPQARYHATRSSIEVEPIDSTGFPVRLQLAGERSIVSFAGWHEEFTDVRRALECFAFGLSEACRLRVSYRGETPVAWAVESRRAGCWEEDSETGLLIVPFWRERRTAYLQNRLLPESPVPAR